MWGAVASRVKHIWYSSEVLSTRWDVKWQLRKAMAHTCRALLWVWGDGDLDGSGVANSGYSAQ